jgi:hypothetical protein
VSLKRSAQPEPPSPAAPGPVMENYASDAEMVALSIDHAVSINMENVCSRSTFHSVDGSFADGNDEIGCERID